MTTRYALHRGDCLEVLPTLELASVDAVVTDPPYSSGGMFRGDRMLPAREKYVSSDAKHATPDFSGDNRDQRGYLAWSTLWLTAARHAAKPGAVAAVFTDWRQLATTTDALQAAGWVFRGIAAWVKHNARPCRGRYAQHCEFVVWGTNGPRPMAGRCGRGAWTADSPRGDNRVHITQKPADVMRGLLSIFEPGQTILDPFAGSGATGLAALELGLEFVGVELDAHFYAVARERLEAAAAKAATPLFPDGPGDGFLPGVADAPGVHE